MSTLGAALSAFLKDFRHRGDLSQGQLAAKLDMSRVTVNRWEGEKGAGSASLNDVEKIAAIAGESPATVLGFSVQGAQPSNAELLAEIRALRDAQKPLDPLIGEIAGIIGGLDDTKRPEALALLRRFAAAATASPQVLKKKRDPS